MLVVSPSARQSGEFMQKVMGFVRMLGAAPKGDGNNRLSVKLGEEMFVAVRPMLAASAGDLWLLSTPAGQGGYFWDAWTFGGEGWMRMSVRRMSARGFRRSFWRVSGRE